MRELYGYEHFKANKGVHTPLNEGYQYFMTGKKRIHRKDKLNGWEMFKKRHKPSSFRVEGWLQFVDPHFIKLVKYRIWQSKRSPYARHNLKVLSEAARRGVLEPIVHLNFNKKQTLDVNEGSRSQVRSQSEISKIIINNETFTQAIDRAISLLDYAATQTNRDEDGSDHGHGGGGDDSDHGGDHGGDSGDVSDHGGDHEGGSHHGGKPQPRQPGPNSTNVDDVSMSDDEEINATSTNNDHGPDGDGQGVRVQSNGNNSGKSGHELESTLHSHGGDGGSGGSSMFSSLKQMVKNLTNQLNSKLIQWNHTDNDAEKKQLRTLIQEVAVQLNTAKKKLHNNEKYIKQLEKDKNTNEATIRSNNEIILTRTYLMNTLQSELAQEKSKNDSNQNKINYLQSSIAEHKRKIKEDQQVNNNLQSTKQPEERIDYYGNQQLMLQTTGSFFDSDEYLFAREVGYDLMDGAKSLLGGIKGLGYGLAFVGGYPVEAILDILKEINQNRRKSANEASYVQSIPTTNNNKLSAIETVGSTGNNTLGGNTISSIFSWDYMQHIFANTHDNTTNTNASPAKPSKPSNATNHSSHASSSRASSSASSSHASSSTGQYTTGLQQLIDLGLLQPTNGQHATVNQTPSSFSSASTKSAGFIQFVGKGTNSSTDVSTDESSSEFESDAASGTEATNLAKTNTDAVAAAGGSVQARTYYDRNGKSKNYKLPGLRVPKGITGAEPDNIDASRGEHGTHKDRGGRKDNKGFDDNEEK